MLSKVKQNVELCIPPRETLVHLSVLVSIVAVLSFVGVANEATELQDTLQDIANFISLIVLGVAVPNGAYGFLQYMTAGSNVEQDEKGRTRIRNTFIGLAGVAVIQTAVNVFETSIDLDTDV